MTDPVEELFVQAATQQDRESCDMAMTVIRSWLETDYTGDDSTTAREKIEHIVEEVRKIRGYGLDRLLNDWMYGNCDDESVSLRELQERWIGMPFFSPPSKKSGSIPEPKKPKVDYMSGAISKVARSCLKNYLKFDVRFESWEGENFDTTIKSDDLPKLTEGATKHQFLTSIANMLRLSTNSNAQDEVTQLFEYKKSIEDLLKVHGYGFEIKFPPAEDFSFHVAEKEKCSTAFLYGEAKRIDGLPSTNQPPRTIVELCWFGFASYVCQNPHGNPRLTSRLRELLGIREAPPAKPEDKHILPESCSSLVQNLIALEDENADKERLDDAVPEIKKKLQEGQVDAKDALSVWGAVMKACFETVEKGKQYSIVMSAKRMWFLKLGLDKESRCIVFITDGIQIGSENANLVLLKFLTYVQPITMDDYDQRKWQDAISIQNKIKIISSGVNPQQRRSKLQRISQNVEGITGSEFDDMQGYDEYGIPTPYFDQICDTVEELGHGRCGVVRKVRWKNDFAAVKGFRHKGEDDRRLPDDIYEHELSVLRDLEPLWGVHVPRLLFHKPWPSNPVIGLQVGEPMPDDMDSWTEEERKSATLSLEEIRKFGWVQNDYRGSNFVRLSRDDGSWSIAAIDLEEMVWSDE